MVGSQTLAHAHWYANAMRIKWEYRRNLDVGLCGCNTFTGIEVFKQQTKRFARPHMDSSIFSYCSPAIHSECKLGSLHQICLGCCWKTIKSIVSQTNCKAVLQPVVCMHLGDTAAIRTQVCGATLDLNKSRAFAILQWCYNVDAQHSAMPEAALLSWCSYS